MKKFIFVLMWIQFGWMILSGIFGDFIFKFLDYPAYISALNYSNDFIAFWVLYVAWRVTPESKQ